MEIDEKLKRFDLASGIATAVRDMRAGVGNSCNRDGTILVGSSGGGPIQRLLATGGPGAPVTRLDVEHCFLGDLMTWFLPDGKHFLYLRHSNFPEKRGIYAASIDAKPEDQDTR